MRDMDCTTAQMILNREESLSGVEKRRLEVHLNTCPDCAMEHRLLGILQDECIEVILPRDPFTDKGIMDRMIRRVNATNAIGSRLRQNPLPVAAGLAAVLLVGFVGGVLMSDPVSDRSVVPAVATDAAASVRSPDVTADLLLFGRTGHRHLSASEGIRPGSHLDSHDSPLGFRTSCGISVILDPETSVSVIRMDHQVVEMRLLRGRMLSSVMPRMDGQVFAVTTAEARMVVTGTVFSVSRDERTALTVLRGSVEVHDNAETKQLRGVLRTDQQGHSPQWHSEPVSPSERDVLWAGLRQMDLLDSERSLHLDVDTRPMNAEIFVDGAFMGRSPLTARVRSGERTLTIRKDGYRSITEQIEALSETGQNRTYVLEQTIPTEPTATMDASSADTGEITTVAHARASRLSTDERMVPAQLMIQAQQYRIQRDWANAAQTYRKILSQSPSSTEAGVAMVSLGNLELNRFNRPRQALRHYDRYLKRGGPLSQEALYGKARALRSLGMSGREKHTLEVFALSYPGAMEIPEVQRRLGDLR